MQLLTWTGALALLLCVSYTSAELYRQSRQVSASNQPGLCRYGRRLDCCYGWQKSSEGRCEAQCERGCKHGECVGPNKCKCFPGYTGKTCNQDLNECGLKPRPCEHRCMNTHGSYMCYCLNGYMLMPDGSCANSRTCALAHCQYGCEEVQGEIRCLCPSSGLQLGVDQRTCVDIDECATRKNLCPYNRRCVNTFGSYFCKCQVGFDLKYVNGKYDCADIDECSNETHRCGQHAVCTNTRGSYKCKCKSGFRGNGTDCTAIPDVPGRPPHSRLDNEQIRNTIPEAPVTTDPRVRLQPFDYDGEVYVGNHGDVEPREQLPEEEEEEEAGGKKEDNQENQIKSEELPPRGDVFFPKDFKSVFGPQTEVKEIPLVPGREEFILDCDFQQGACEWVQNREDDFDWKVVRRDKGTGYYMAASAPPGNRKALGRLELQLRGQTEPGVFCLTFSFRLSGEREAALRVVLDNDSYPAWEEQHGGGAGGRRGRGQAWQTEFLTVAWEEDRPQSIVFEAEQGDGAGGEVGLDGVMLNSGSCQEHQPSLF